MDQNVSQALILVIGGMIGSLLTFSFTYWSKRREELLDRKREVYDKLLQPYLAFFHETLARKHKVQPSIEKKLGQVQELSFLLPLHAPDLVFRAFQKVQQKGVDLDNATEASREAAFVAFNLALGELLLEVRKDLGYRRTSLTGVDIIRNLIPDIDEHARKHGL